MDTIFGRISEKKQLDKILNSDHAEFLVVYGRRRVGKTHLIHEYVGDKFGFYVSGVLNSGIEVQQAAFRTALEAFGLKESKATTWLQLFQELRQLLSERLSAPKPCVVFLDELSCFDTANSNFMSALDNFWNAWAVWQKNLKLIVCGSATSWIIDKLINNHGGLHNRLTSEMYLRPFTLAETEQYLQSKGVRWDRSMVIEAYMVFGGIPYYLNLVEKGDSFAQMIDKAYFAQKAPLKHEYRRLFTSLYRSPEPYIKIVETLAQCKQGLTRKQIAEKIHNTSGGRLSKLLENLINCDFVRRYYVRTKTKVSAQECIYSLSDLFTLFHLHFSPKNITEDNFWQTHINTSLIRSWQGLAFEQVVMHHIPQIKQALGISGMGVEYYAWRSKETNPLSQIDLILDRADNLMNICEIKYSRVDYQLNKSELDKLRERNKNFLIETGTHKGTLLTLITSVGLKQNDYIYAIDKHITANELFT